MFHIVDAIISIRLLVFLITVWINIYLVSIKLKNFKIKGEICPLFRCPLPPLSHKSTMFCPSYMYFTNINYFFITCNMHFMGFLVPGVLYYIFIVNNIYITTQTTPYAAH